MRRVGRVGSAYPGWPYGARNRFLSSLPTLVLGSGGSMGFLHGSTPGRKVSAGIIANHNHLRHSSILPCKRQWHDCSRAAVRPHRPRRAGGCDWMGWMRAGPGRNSLAVLVRQPL